MIGTLVVSYSYLLLFIKLSIFTIESSLITYSCVLCLCNSKHAKSAFFEFSAFPFDDRCSGNKLFLRFGSFFVRLIFGEDFDLFLKEVDRFVDLIG